MDTLAFAIFCVIAASVATVRWLTRAPIGYEDANGFHVCVDANDPADDYSPIRAPSQPPFLPHGL